MPPLKEYIFKHKRSRVEIKIFSYSIIGATSILIAVVNDINDFVQK